MKYRQVISQSSSEASQKKPSRFSVCLVFTKQISLNPAKKLLLAEFARPSQYFPSSGVDDDSSNGKNTDCYHGISTSSSYCEKVVDGICGLFQHCFTSPENSNIVRTLASKLKQFLVFFKFLVDYFYKLLECHINRLLVYPIVRIP